MRTIKIDEKWGATAIDPNDGTADNGIPFITRYGEKAHPDMTNVELAMVWRIMELEDKMKIAKEALKISADSGSICSSVSEEALTEIVQL